MTRKIMIHDFASGQSYERDMTETEEAQADLDLETLQHENTPVSEPDDVVEETPKPSND